MVFDGRGYTSKISDNLLILSDEGRRELAAGRGKELGEAHRFGKIAAPWSSAARAINFFESWCTLDKGPRRWALEASGVFSDLQFRGPVPTGFGAAPANLDFVLNGRTTAMIGIESNFREPFEGGMRGTPRSSASVTGARFDIDRRRAVDPADGTNARETVATVATSSGRPCMMRSDGGIGSTEAIGRGAEG